MDYGNRFLLPSMGCLEMDGTLKNLLPIIQAYGEALHQPGKFFYQSKVPSWHMKLDCLLP